jgi:hypothetical protein
MTADKTVTVLYAVTVVMAAVTTTTNPGYVPWNTLNNVYRPPVPTLATKIVETKMMETTMMETTMPPINLITPQSPYTYKYCNTCNIFRPPRSKHCNTCNTCVYGFDHHCPWIGNCIASNNYNYFVAFLISVTALVGVYVERMMRVCFGYFCFIFWNVRNNYTSDDEIDADSDTNTDTDTDTTTNASTIYTTTTTTTTADDANTLPLRYTLLMIISLPTFISLLSLLVYHIQIIGNNETTYENVRRVYKRKWGKDSFSRSYGNVYDRGFLRNVIDFCCGNRMYEPAEYKGNVVEEPKCTYIGEDEEKRFVLPDGNCDVVCGDRMSLEVYEDSEEGNVA